MTKKDKNLLKNIPKKVNKLVNKTIQRIDDISKGIRKDYPPDVRNILKKYGDYKITKIVLAKRPVNKILLNLLNTMAENDIKKQVEKNGYDNVYHLAMFIYLMNPTTGSQVMIKNEKNEVINMQVKTNIKDYQTLDVPINNKSISLNDFQNNAQKNIGKIFFLYNSYKNNCQIYINNLLKYNNLNNQETDKFILQDIQPKGITRKFAKQLTNLGAITNVLINGR